MFFQANAQFCYTSFEEEIDDFTLYNTLNFMTFDEEGTLYFGGSSSLGGGLGLGLYDGNNWTRIQSSAGALPNNEVNCVAFYEDSIWVGTENGLAGTNSLGMPAWTVFKTTNGLPDNHVSSILILDDGTMWLGFGNGKVARRSGKSFIVYDVAQTKINKLLADNNGTIWAAVNFEAGGNDKLKYFDGNNWNSAADVLNNIKDIELDVSGNIWANNNTDLFMIDPSNPQSPFTYSPGIDGIVLYQIEIQSDIYLWVNTNLGLVRIYSDNFQFFTSSTSGLPESLSRPLAVNAAGEVFYSYIYVKDTDNFDYAGIGRIQVSSDNYSMIPSGNVSLCMGTEQVLDAGAGYSGYVWMGVPGEQTYAVTKDGVYTVAVDNGSGCYSYDTATVHLLEPYNEQEICVVLVDEGKNLIAWERTYNQHIWYYKVYKETENLDEYVAFDSVYFSELPIVIDKNSQPDVVADKYKLSVVDSCGNESELSPHHRTLHLQANLALGGGVNLDWEHYEGLPFDSYIIMRGTSPDAMEDLAVIPADRTHYSDIPAVEQTYYYQVAIELPCICDPSSRKKVSSGPFTRSVSNLKSLKAGGELEMFLSDTTLQAAAPEGTFIGKLSLKHLDEVIDIDFTLAEGEGDTDNSKFSIYGDSLLTASVFAYDLEKVYSILVRAGEEELEGGVLDQVFTLKVNRMVGIRDPEFSEGISILPNPVESEAIIRVSASGPYTVKVIDLTGKVVKTISCDIAHEIHFTRSGLASGLYLLEISGDKVYRGKVIIK